MKTKGRKLQKKGDKNAICDICEKKKFSKTNFLVHLIGK